MQIILLIIGFVIIYKAKILIYKVDKIHINKEKIQILPFIMYALILGYLYDNYNMFSTLMYLIIFLILYYVALIDKQEGIIPDKYTVAILLIAIVKIITFKLNFITVAYSAMPIILLYLIVEIVEFIFDDNAMGGGDLKLLFALSLALGLENILFLLFLSNLFFILRIKDKEVSPYGPYMYSGYIGMFFLNEIFYRFIFI